MNGVVLLRADRRRGSAEHPRHLHPALELKVVSAGLQGRGIPVSLIDAWVEGGTPADWCAWAMAARPRIAVIKGETWCLAESMACATELRRHGVRTVAIGQQVGHASRSEPAQWREAFDHAIDGEPESVLLDWLPRVIVAEGRPDDFATPALPLRLTSEATDILPFPRFTLQEMESFAFPFPLPGPPLRRWAYVLTSRGCPHRCRHCSTVVRKSSGSDLRRRDPRRVVDEVVQHLDDGAEAIAFEDDTLFVDRRHVLGLCDELARRGLRVPWIASARPDELDEERVAAAAASGACLLKLGIESATPRLVEAMGKARRGIDWVLQTEEGMGRLRRYGIASVGMFLVGLPTETAAEAAATREWAQRLAPDYVQVQIFRAYPDTPWWLDLPGATRDSIAAYHYGPVAATAAAMEPEALPALQREFYRRYYLRPGFVFTHARRCWRHYLSATGIVAGISRLRYIGARIGAEAPHGRAA